MVACMLAFTLPNFPEGCSGVRKKVLEDGSACPVDSLLQIKTWQVLRGSLPGRQLSAISSE